MTDINPTVVELLCDVDMSTYPNLVRESTGTPLTSDEVHLVGSATVADLRAAQRYMEAATDLHATKAADARRLCELLDEHRGDLTRDTAVGVITDRMPPAARAEFDEIAARLAPDGSLA